MPSNTGEAGSSRGIKPDDVLMMLPLRMICTVTVSVARKPEVDTKSRDGNVIS